MTAHRIKGYAELDTKEMCYWKVSDGSFLLYIPGVGVGNLKSHDVKEHEDGTITVWPSILCQGHDNGNPTTIHGFLTKGVWKDC